MTELDLDGLDAELLRVSDSLAAQRSFSDLPAEIRRVRRRPYLRAAWTAVLGGGLVALGLLDGSAGAVGAGLAVLLLFALPSLCTAARRARQGSQLDRSMLEECAAEAKASFANDVALLVLALPLAVGLAILAWCLPGARWLFWVAGGLVLGLPLVVFVSLPRSAGESLVAGRWLREEEDELNEEEDEEEEEIDDDLDDVSLLGPVAFGLTAAFFVVVAPFVSLVLTVAAVLGPERLSPALGALGLAVGSSIWLRFTRNRLRGWWTRVVGDDGPGAGDAPSGQQESDS